MNRTVVTAAFAAVIASSSLAFADQTTGMVRTFDPSALTLTLQDGSIYYLPQNFKNPGLKAGERVQVSWTSQGGKHMANAVTIQQ